MNARANKVAELLALESENYLKAGNKMGEEELEKNLDELVSLLSYVNGKDVFEAFYKKYLSKRLLLNRSHSEEAERMMIMKLKPECGNQFTNKLEGMFKDISVSEELTSQFKKISTFNLSFKMQVLTAGSWPFYKEYPIILPPIFLDPQQQFQKFYLEKHDGRKLSWLYSLSMCVVNAFFDKGKKFLSVSMFQSIVLLLFNQHTQISFKQFQEFTNLGRSFSKLFCF